MRPPTRAVLSATAWFAALSVLPKALAVIKDMVVAARFGAGQMLDVYLIAFVLIGVPVSIVVVAIQTTLIPALVNKQHRAAAGLLGGGIKLAVVLLVFALPIWLAILPFALNMLYPASADRAGHQILSACLWLIPYYFLNGVNLLLYGALQSRKVFWPNAMLPSLFPVAILTALWLTPEASIHALLLGTVAGSLLEGFSLYVVIRREGMLQLRRTRGSGLMPVVRLALPLMAGGVVASMAPVVEQLIAFRLGPGALSLLSYGNKVPAAVNSILLTAIGVVILPHFAELLSRREWCSCRRLHIQLSGVALGIGILVAGPGMVHAESIIQVLFERGAFSSADSREAAAVMRAYLMQLPFLLVAMISMRALIAMGRTLEVTWIATTQLVLASWLAYDFSSHNGVVGVAMGTVVAAMLGASALGVTAGRRFNQQCRERAA